MSKESKEKEYFSDGPVQRWHFPKVDKAQIERYSEKLNIDPLLARLMLIRGVKESDYEND